MEAALKGLSERRPRGAFTGGSPASVVAILEGSGALTVMPRSVVFARRRSRVLAAPDVGIDHPPRGLGLPTPPGAPGPAVVASPRGRVRRTPRAGGGSAPTGAVGPEGLEPPTKAL